MNETQKENMTTPKNCKKQPETFWLVWNPAGSHPSVLHRDRKKAFVEAERIALRVNGPVKLLRAEVEGECRPASPPVTWTRFE